MPLASPGLHNAPVVHVRGYSYKGSVAVADRPADH